MSSLPGETGGMVSLAADGDAAERLLAGTGAVVAAFNGSARTVVSGPVSALEAVVARAGREGIDSTRLRVSHAFHSPLVAGAVEPLRQAFATLLPGERGGRLVRPVVSTVSGRALDADADLSALLCRQVTDPVRFTAALAAARDEADLWIEVGPGRALTELAAESLSTPTIALDAGGRSLAGLLKAAGAAFAAGTPVKTEVLFEGRFTRPFDLARPLRFLANPCEAAPALDELLVQARAERSRSEGTALATHLPSSAGPRPARPRYRRRPRPPRKRRARSVRRCRSSAP
jgi:enediyne polyketide synthase